MAGVTPLYFQGSEHDPLDPIMSFSGNKDPVRHLLWDAKQLRKIVNSWNKNPALPEDVIYRFVAAEGGLSVVHPARFVQETIFGWFTLRVVRTLEEIMVLSMEIMVFSMV